MKSDLQKIQADRYCNQALSREIAFIRPKKTASTEKAEAISFKSSFYQTRQAFSLTIGWPAWQPHAFWNSGMFCATPFTRNFPGECGSTLTNMREYSGRLFSHHTRAKPRKKRCCGV